MNVYRLLGLMAAGSLVAIACSSAPPQPTMESVGSASSAIRIPGLFPTGVDGANAVLADGTIDPHYRLTASGDPAFPGPNTFVLNSTQYPVSGPWVADNATSKWISVRPGNSGNAAPTTFTYTLAFTLVSVDPATATLSGSWACDNRCVLRLNGKQVAAATTFTTLAAFTVPAGAGSGFALGLNTLDFVVTNDPPGVNPTGLRVEALAGTAGCTQDAQCGAGSWCNNVTVTPAACQPTLGNGVVVTGGSCTAVAAPITGTVGARACATGACDANDGRCGYRNGDGPCASGSVCRSSVCDPAANAGAGVCRQCTAADTVNCTTAAPICDSVSFTCSACNGDNGTTASATCIAATPYCPGGGAACGSCGAAGGVTTCGAAGATHAGLICEPTGACGSACVDDANCNVSTQWCNDAALPSPACQARLANGTPIPTVPGHVPVLNGTCTAAAGAAVCASGVCDTKDNACGYANGDGPCTGNPAVCRSRTCSSDGTCRPAGGCNVDADCGAVRWCDTAAHTCQAKGSTGSPIPGSGTCMAGASGRCLSGVCGSDNVCGFPNGSGPCTTADASGASGVCRSSVCDPAASGGTGLCRQCTPANAGNCAGATPICDSASSTCAACNGDNGTAATAKCSAAAPYCPGGGAGCGTCGAAGGIAACTAPGALHSGLVCEASGACGSACVVDANCNTATQWCDGALLPPSCTARLANGVAIPTVPGHAPPLTGMCTVAAGKAVCLSLVCDTRDNACGYANGDGPCTGNPSVCRSNTCSVDGTCRPATGCNVDGDCTAAQWCDSAAHVCQPKAITGAPLPGGGTCKAGASDRCLSGVCAVDNICGFPDGTGPCTILDAVGPAGVCRSSVCDPARAGGAGLCEQCTAVNRIRCTGATPVCDTTTDTCVGVLSDGGLGGDAGDSGATSDAGEDGGADAGGGGTDGGGEAGGEGGVDGGVLPDAGEDSGPLRDAGVDAALDAGVDAEVDAAVPEAGLPDAGPIPDAGADGAADSGGGTGDGGGPDASTDAAVSSDGGTDGAPPGGDAGSPGADAGSEQDSGDASGPGPGDDGGGDGSVDDGSVQGGGCSCKTSGAGDTKPGASLFALLGTAVALGRRRRRRG